MSRAYKVVDVFSAQPLLGNPVAVVLDAEGLDDATMQNIARWTNLSETTFFLPPTAPEADYRLRIFTPGRELPFAGHPTLGSAYAALEANRVQLRADKLVQQCGVGLVEVAVADEGVGRRLTLTLPPATVRPLSSDDVTELEAALGVTIMREAAPAIVDVGAVWVVAQLSSVDSLLAMTPDLARCSAFEQRLGVTGLTLFAKRGGDGPELEVRSFAPSCGVNEDPVCGSGNGSVAVFQVARGMLPPSSWQYNAAQGRCVGRDGRVTVAADENGNLRVGGACITCVDGTLDL